MTFLTIILICCTVVFYLMASVLYVYNLKTTDERYAFLPLVFTGAGLLCQTGLLGVVAIQHSGTQLSGANIIMLASWTIMVAYFFFELISKRRSYGAFVVPLVLISMLVSWMMGAGQLSPEGMAVYATWPLLVIHIIAYFISAAIFLLGGVSAIMLLYQENLLKVKRDKVLDVRMPGLSFLKKVMRRSVIVGLPILLLGILLGISRALSLGEPWLNSPRVILALIVLMVYCVIAVQTYIIKSPSRTLAKMHILGSSLVILLTVFSAALPMLGR